jgi:hypothetical protein
MRAWTSDCKSDHGAGDTLQGNAQIMAIFDKITACIQSNAAAAGCTGCTL